MQIGLQLKVYTSSKAPETWTLQAEGSTKHVKVVPYNYSGPNGKVIPTTVSAELVGDFRGDCEYWLQVGWDPDTIAKADGGEAEDNKIAFRWKKDKTRFPLFQQTMGRTYLRLLEMAYNEDGDQELSREVMSWPIFVEPPDGKRDRYLKMISQLKDTPQFFMDDLKGQMLINCFSIEWVDGYSSHYNATLELEAVENVLKDLKGPLECICQAPKTLITRCKRIMDVERARHCSHRSDRKIERSRDRGADCIRLLLDVKQTSYAVTAHSVLRHFLRRLIWRCDDILLAFSNDCDRIRRELRVLRKLYNKDLKDPAFIGRSCDMQQKLDKLNDKQRQAKQTRDRIVEICTCRIFCGANRPLSVFDVPRTVFAGGYGYEQAYNIILAFERKHFWWVGQKSDFYKIPRLSFSNDQEWESRWVRKYSMVYEFWCYHRLLKAMETRGCKFLEGNLLSSREGSRCVFQHGDMKIEIIHGLSAKQNDQKNPDAEFWLSTKSSHADMDSHGHDAARERTPDFAIIFSNAKTNKTKWIVADAKSHDKMNFRQIIDKREKYLRFVKRRLPPGAIGSENAAQSWMFYAGEDEPGNCGVECPPLHSGSLKPGEFDSQAGAEGYAFSAINGISRKGEADLPRGHVRANVWELDADNSPFEDFVSGEIATMVRELS